MKRRFITSPQWSSAAGAKAGVNIGRAQRDEPARLGCAPIVNFAADDLTITVAPQGRR